MTHLSETGAINRLQKSAPISGAGFRRSHTFMLTRLSVNRKINAFRL